MKTYHKQPNEKRKKERSLARISGGDADRPRALFCSF
jgi:hypothetical protein